MAVEVIAGSHFCIGDVVGLNPEDGLAYPYRAPFTAIGTADRDIMPGERFTPAQQQRVSMSIEKPDSVVLHLLSNPAGVAISFYDLTVLLIQVALPVDLARQLGVSLIDYAAQAERGNSNNGGGDGI